MTPVRVLIADDEPAVRDALAELIGMEPSLTLVGAAGDLTEVVQLAREEQPDVALVDARMPDGGGPRAVREIRNLSPGTRILALSAYDDQETVLRMLGAGAAGYMVKSTSATEILDSIHSSLRGAPKLSAEVTDVVVRELAVHLEEREREAQVRQAKVGRVKRILETDALTMVFQPILELSSRDIVGLEALARISSEPEQSTSEWFLEAKEVGLAVDLEILAMRAAASCIGGFPPDVYLTVNVSPEALLSGRLTAALTDEQAARAVIELTEHAAVDDYRALDAALSEWRARGTRLAIDDVGAGFSSLNHVLALSPDMLKLDNRLTHAIDTDSARRALVSSLASFAGTTGVAVVAEGIETSEQLEAVRELGVRYGQGYFLAEAGPAPWGPCGGATDAGPPG